MHLPILHAHFCPLACAHPFPGQVLRETSKNVFVPLTIGGGIRDTVDPDGTPHSALEVASEYFRSGADKVSIGSDAVLIAEEYIRTGQKTGKSVCDKGHPHPFLFTHWKCFLSTMVSFLKPPPLLFSTNP